MKKGRPKLEAKKKALEIARLALDKKAEKVIILDTKKLSSVADYMMICSAESERQVGAIADAIEEGLAKKGIKPLGIEGASGGKWALMDYVDVVAHIFLEPVRVFYDLEGLWAEAKVTELKEKKPKPAASEPKEARPKAAPKKAPSRKKKTE